MPSIPLKPSSKDSERKIPGFAVCDIESAAGWINFLVIGLAWKLYEDEDLKEKRYEHFLNLAEFCDYVFEEEQPHDVIYAHFGGRYDFSFILREFFYKHENYHIHKMIPRGSGLLCFSVSKFVRTRTLEPGMDTDDILSKTKDGHYLVIERTIEFRDSSAMLPFGLGNLTKNFKVDHKKQEIDYDKITYVTLELLEYLEYDCWGLYEVIEKYFRWPIIREAGPAMTMASQALRVFRTFLKEPINSLKPHVDDFVRSSYFGGRTEIFKPFFQQTSTSGMINSYDVNSLYPAVMLKLDMPTSFKFETKFYLENQMGFYDVEVFVPDTYVPVLGIKFANMEDRLIFPTGTFRGVWSTSELNYAMTQGVKILKVHKGMIFNNGGNIFKDYITTFYDMRKKAEKGSVDDILSKLLMNSLYGRFALNLNREQLVLDEGQLGVSPHMEIPLDAEGKRIIRLAKHDIVLENSFTNAAIAAWVTSGARIWMHKLYNKAPDHLYYTDSVTEDRMVMVMNRYGHIKTISMKNLWEEVQDVKAVGDKYKGDLEKWTLSYNSELQTMEWRKVEKVIRHKVDKKIVATRSNKGASTTTTDHSYIDEFNNKVKPSELHTHFSPKLLKVPRGAVLDSIDLLNYIPDQSDLLHDENWIWAKASPKSKRTHKKIKFKRFIRGADLKDFCLLAGYYVTEGSACFKPRFSFSISSEKIEFQEKLRTILVRLSEGAIIGHIKSSKKDDCYALRSGTKTFAIIFAQLFGKNSCNKKLPDFVFNLGEECHRALLNSMILGDGCKLFGKAFSSEYREKNFSYCTTSFTLLNQLCALLSFDGQCYSISYRHAKKAWSLQTSDKNRTKKPLISEVKYDGYVYDLQVENNNNFFDCEGLIGLHNTDCMKTTHTYPHNNKDLGELKLEYKMKFAAYLLPKTYIEDTTTPIFAMFDEAGKLNKEETSSKKIVMKGFDKKKISKFTSEDFTSALEGDMRRLLTLNPKKFAPLRTALNKGQFLALLDESPWQIRTRYNKRRVFKSAWAQVYDTEALHIKDGLITNLPEEVLKKWKAPTLDEMSKLTNELIKHMEGQL